MKGIVTATLSELSCVRNITLTTIAEVYPHYYPQGAVDFFLEHHNDNSILSDILRDCVFLYEDGQGNRAGTVTVRENEICRLFVLPEYQGRGYGKMLLDFAESRIFESFPEIVLDASLSAKNIYLNRGYNCVGYHIINTRNGDNLCYDVMKKRRPEK